VVGSNKTAVSEDTVKGQVRNILPKLGAKNRAHAGVIGGRRGIIELIKQIPELDILGDARKAKLAIELRTTRIGGLVEFSRAVHAEMDALLSAARKGTSLIASRLFVTIFPCHYGARHIVTAGVVQPTETKLWRRGGILDLRSESHCKRKT
jgi:Cytidine and deoxycytidylate deaminase zinc-binding region